MKNRLLLYFEGRSTAVTGTVGGAIAALLIAGLLTPLLIAVDGGDNPADMAILITAMGFFFGVLFGVGFSIGLAGQRSSMDEQLGTALHDEQRAALLAWYLGATPRPPQAAGLQPLLPRYLDLLERRFTGMQVVTVSQRNWLIGLGLLQIVLNLYWLSSDPLLPFLHVIAIGMFVLAIVQMVRTGGPQPKANKRAVRWNRKKLARLDEMRRQLAAQEATHA